MTPNTSSSRFFEAKYRAAPDPWCFETNPYENGRYREILEAIGDRRFRRAFEPGCSVGVLTSQLANRCHELIAIDIAPTAVQIARDRCRAFSHVHISAADFLHAVPRGPFDLIVLSEIGYYFTPKTLDSISQRVVDELEPGGMLVAVHWLGESTDHLLSGDEVHERLIRLPVLANTLSLRIQRTSTECFRLDRWTRQ